MSSDFDKMMNEKMEQAKLDELMPGFNRGAEWEQLEQRIPEKKKTRLLPVWWTHVAAVVAGILIGSSLLLLNNKKDVTQPTVTVQHKQPVQQPEMIKQTDTVYLTKEVIIEKPVPAPVKRPIVQQPTLQPQPKTETIIVQEKPIENPAPQLPEAPTKGVKTSKEIKVVHLLDVENEDRESALNNYDPSKTTRSGFVLHISQDRLPDKKTQEPNSLLNSLRKN